jgi:hypothetical protein
LGTYDRAWEPNNFREIANKLREAAAACQFASDRQEILHLAAGFESRADHLNQRA